MQGNQLKAKAVNGVFWTFTQRFMSIFIQFISNIILARLLTPDDYGCIGMLTIFMLLSATIIDGGFSSALIQKKRPTQEDYSTIFFWNVGLSIVIYLILFCSADTLIFGSSGNNRLIMLRYVVEAVCLFLLLGIEIYKGKHYVGTREIIFSFMVIMVLCAGIFNNDLRGGNLYIIMLLMLGLLISKLLTLEEFAEYFCSFMKIIAAVSAAVAEELGTDVSAIRILSFKKI